MLLMQRLGLSSTDIDFMTNQRDVEFCQLKFNLRQARITGNDAKAEKILKDNADIISKLDPIERQTFDFMEICLKVDKKEMSNEEALHRLVDILKVTHPLYTPENLPQFLSYEDILLLNKIAIMYDLLGDRNKAIEILYHIKEFYDKQVCDIEEALRTQTMILYNLSKVLGLAGRYAECIHICELGIKLAHETDRRKYLQNAYYNMSWCMYYRNNPGDYEASIYYMKLAYYSAWVLGKKDSVEKYAKIILDRYKIKVESLI